MSEKLPVPEFSQTELRQRFDGLIKSALNTRPKTLKIMGQKEMSSQSKKRLKRAKRAA
jgi:hypothetical protein